MHRRLVSYIFGSLISTEQDEGLEELAKAVQRQKHIGLAMHDEVEQQDGVWLRLCCWR